VAGVGSGAREMHPTGLTGLHEQMLPHFSIGHLAGADVARKSTFFETLSPTANHTLAAPLACQHPLVDVAYRMLSFDVTL